ncbi:hypothetical protein J6590_054112 [Homalodisca vitripennis]|nr:hypothetical protein J6590_054112 [Homalodisca vitripennis]
MYVETEFTARLIRKRASGAAASGDKLFKVGYDSEGWNLRGNLTGLSLQNNNLDCGFIVFHYADIITMGLNPCEMAIPPSKDLRRNISSLHLMRVTQLVGSYIPRDIFTKIRPKKCYLVRLIVFLIPRYPPQQFPPSQFPYQL